MEGARPVPSLVELHLVAAKRLTAALCSLVMVSGSDGAGQNHQCAALQYLGFLNVVALADDRQRDAAVMLAADEQLL